MKSFIKKISHRILVISMITIVLSFFSVSSVSQAKLSLDDSEFYYTGTQNSEVMWEEAAWRKLVNKYENTKEIGKNLLSYFVLSYFFPFFIGKGQKTSKGRNIYYNLYNIIILYKSYNRPVHF